MRYILLIFSLLVGLSSLAWAQQPVALPAAPTAPSPDTVASPVVPAPQQATAGPVPGHRYEVKLQSGVSFTGVLKEVTANGLVFEAQGLGQLTVLPANMAQLQDLDAPNNVRLGQRLGYYDIGSGSRYFFGPSGRNLRAGEGVVQYVDIFLAGANYGITNNISLGGYLSLVPGLAIGDQLLVLTPKVGFEVGPKWSLGAGALYLHVADVNAGLLYGVATRGSADNNFSLGVGYGFANGSIGNTPTLYIAGQTRVSRRISLLTENYIVAAKNQVFGGLYGVKFNWPRVSLGMAAMYAGYINNTSPSDSYFFTTYAYPVYIDLAFRFGKPYNPQKQP